MVDCGVRSFLIASLGIAPLLPVSPSRASEAYDECRMRSVRPEVPRLTTVLRADGTRRVAVDIFLGETLCLAGIEGGEGSMRLVARAPISDVVELRLEADQYETTLRIRHQNYSREIEYTVGYPARGTTDIIVSERDSATPGAPNDDRWPGRIERLVLYAFSSVPRPDPYAVDYRWGFLGVSFVSAFHFAPVDDLNAEFERNGFSTVGSLQPYLGFGFDASLGGFRPNLDVTFGLNRAGDDRSPDVDQVMIALGIGYAVYRTTGLELFPMLGITGGDIGVDIRSDDPAIAFSGLVVGEQRVRNNVSLLLLSLGADVRHEFWPRHEGGLIAAVRAGYGYQFWSGGWVQEEPAWPDLRGGPEIDTSGPFVRLALGVYAH